MGQRSAPVSHAVAELLETLPPCLHLPEESAAAQEPADESDDLPELHSFVAGLRREFRRRRSGLTSVDKDEAFIQVSRGFHRFTHKASFY
ncbi:hypothetical protein ABZ860_35760 [Microbispora sp. NPDC046973]|uniref:hypothetical protein n=1 Tax=Microbispora sp. NPDC046973 TaxID=3155022 RepID=UPI0033D23F05